MDEMTETDVHRFSETYIFWGPGRSPEPSTVEITQDRLDSLV